MTESRPFKTIFSSDAPFRNRDLTPFTPPLPAGRPSGGQDDFTPFLQVARVLQVAQDVEQNPIPGRDKDAAVQAGLRALAGGLRGSDSSLREQVVASDYARGLVSRYAESIDRQMGQGDVSSLIETTRTMPAELSQAIWRSTEAPLQAGLVRQIRDGASLSTVLTMARTLPAEAARNVIGSAGVQEALVDAIKGLDVQDARFDSRWLTDLSQLADRMQQLPRGGAAFDALAGALRDTLSLDYSDIPAKTLADPAALTALQNKVFAAVQQAQVQGASPRIFERVDALNQADPLGRSWQKMNESPAFRDLQAARTEWTALQAKGEVWAKANPGVMAKAEQKLEVSYATLIEDAAYRDYARLNVPRQRDIAQFKLDRAVRQERPAAEIERLKEGLAGAQLEEARLAAVDTPAYQAVTEAQRTLRDLQGKGEAWLKAHTDDAEKAQAALMSAQSKLMEDATYGRYDSLLAEQQLRQARADLKQAEAEARPDREIGRLKGQVTLAEKGASDVRLRQGAIIAAEAYKAADKSAAPHGYDSVSARRQELRATIKAAEDEAGLIAAAQYRGEGASPSEMKAAAGKVKAAQTALDDFNRGLPPDFKSKEEAYRQASADWQKIHADAEGAKVDTQLRWLQDDYALALDKNDAEALKTLKPLLEQAQGAQKDLMIQQKATDVRAQTARFGEIGDLEAQYNAFRDDPARMSQDWAMEVYLRFGDAAVPLEGTKLRNLLGQSLGLVPELSALGLGSSASADQIQAAVHAHVEAGQDLYPDRLLDDVDAITSRIRSESRKRGLGDDARIAVVPYSYVTKPEGKAGGRANGVLYRVENSKGEAVFFVDGRVAPDQEQAPVYDDIEEFKHKNQLPGFDSALAVAEGGRMRLSRGAIAMDALKTGARIESGIETVQREWGSEIMIGSIAAGTLGVALSPFTGGTSGAWGTALMATQITAQGVAVGGMIYGGVVSANDMYMRRSIGESWTSEGMIVDGMTIGSTVFGLAATGFGLRYALQIGRASRVAQAGDTALAGTMAEGAERTMTALAWANRASWIGFAPVGWDGLKLMTDNLGRGFAPGEKQAYWLNIAMSLAGPLSAHGAGRAARGYAQRRGLGAYARPAVDPTRRYEADPAGRALKASMADEAKFRAIPPDGPEVNRALPFARRSSAPPAETGTMLGPDRGGTPQAPGSLSAYHPASDPNARWGTEIPATFRRPQETPQPFEIPRIQTGVPEWLPKPTPTGPQAATVHPAAPSHVQAANRGQPAPAARDVGTVSSGHAAPPPGLPRRVPGRTFSSMEERVDPQFRQRLVDLVREKGKITFADFMEHSLYGIDGEGGYYNSGLVRIGDDADFFTAASLSRHFGGTIARALADMHAEMGSPSRFDIVEMGAGHGNMAKAILDKIATDYPSLYRALRYVIVERSAGLIPRQQALLGGRPVQWVHASASELPIANIRGAFISNELVDVFPVHRVVKRGGRLKEIYVTLGDDGRFVTTEDEPSPALEAVRAHIEELVDLSSLRDSTELTINARSIEWMRRLAAALDEGYVLTFDYGHPGAVLDIPYTVLQNQKPLELALRYPGALDITALVDFALLSQAGERVGLSPYSLRGGRLYESQAQFLRRHGLLEEIARERDAEERVKAGRLLSEFLGFTVLVQRKDRAASDDLAKETEPRPEDRRHGAGHDADSHGTPDGQRHSSGQNGTAAAGARSTEAGEPLLYSAGANYIGLQHPGDPDVLIMAVFDDPSITPGQGPATTPEVQIRSFHRGDLPAGSGSRLLAHLFEHYGIRPSERLVFRNVDDAQPGEAFRAGDDSAMTVLGRSGARALRRLGLEASGYRLDRNSAGGVDLVIEIAPPAHSYSAGAYHPASDPHARWVSQDHIVPSTFMRPMLPEAPRGFEIPRIMAGTDTGGLAEASLRREIAARIASSSQDIVPIPRLTREKAEPGARDQLLNSALPVIEDPAGRLYLPRGRAGIGQAAGPSHAIGGSRAERVKPTSFREPLPRSPESHMEGRPVDEQWIFRPNHKRRDATKTVPIRPEIHVISAFGTADSMFDLQGRPITAIMDLRRRLITPRRLANRLSEGFGLDERSYIPGQPIALLAEHTGAGGRDAFAQQLANEVHAPVYALRGGFEEREWLLFFPDAVSHPTMQPDLNRPHLPGQEGQAVRIRWTLLEKREGADLDILAPGNPIRFDQFLAPQDAFVINAHMGELLRRGAGSVAASAREAGYAGDRTVLLLPIERTPEVDRFAGELAEALQGSVLVLEDSAWHDDDRAVRKKNTAVVPRLEGGTNRPILIDAEGQIAFADTKEDQVSVVWRNFGPVQLPHLTRGKAEPGARDRLLSSALPVIEDPAGRLHLPRGQAWISRDGVRPPAVGESGAKRANSPSFREPIPSSPEGTGPFQTSHPLSASDYPLEAWMATYVPETGMFYTEARRVDTQWVSRRSRERRDITNIVLIRPDVHVISAFGTADSMFDLQGRPVTAIMDLRRRLITPRRLANRLSEGFGLDERSYTPGQPIALLAEHTGAGGRGAFAQQLANEVHAPVYALRGGFEEREWLLFFPDAISHPAMQPDLNNPRLPGQEGQAVRIRWTLLEKREGADLDILAPGNPIKFDQFLAPQDTFAINAHMGELLRRGAGSVAASAREAGYAGGRTVLLLPLEPTPEVNRFAGELAEALQGPVLVLEDSAWRNTGRAVRKNTVTVSRVEGAANRRISDEDGRITFVDTNESQSVVWLNFGPMQRSFDYSKQKQGAMADLHLMVFDVPRSIVEDIRRNAVLQSEARIEGNEGRPILGDWLASPDQFGISWDQAVALQDLIIPGSVKTIALSRAADEGSKLAPQLHPKPDEWGRAVTIASPTRASDPATWADPAQTAIFIPEGPYPDRLNGVALAAWDAPITLEGWKNVAGVNHDLHEPSHEGITKAGVAIIEPDGRIWIIQPTNNFAGARAFPGGTVEGGLSLQATAVKEAYEETGLHVELVAHLADIRRASATVRYYVARRIGGTPSEMGWETQSVHLVPKNLVPEILTTKSTKKVFNILAQRGFLQP